MPRYIAFDLGASNGRCILGYFDGHRLSLQVIHQFENRPIELMGHLYWDILGIFDQIKHGLVKAGREWPGEIDSIGVDTWGCDFALLDEQGKLVGNPYCYRDPQTRGMFAEAFRRVTKEEIFRQTGLQFMELNSLFQLLAMQVRGDPAYQIAATYLHIPDVLHYWLTGIKACEYTGATTSQLLDANHRDWAYPLMRALGFPEEIFPPVIQPSTVLGSLRPAVVEEVGLEKLRVIATATHDTAAAVVAAPATGERFGYISSGTWALLGKEIDQPLVTTECMYYNITNEGGAFGKVLLLRNIANLWLLQECRRHWAMQGEELSWDHLSGLAAQAQAFKAFIDPDHPLFLLPGNMPARILGSCQDSGQAIPETKGEIIRLVLESLAFKYRYTLDRLTRLTKEPVKVMHIIGGGSRNRLLNQFSANALQIPVIAGPFEATAIGNILTQMVATGELSSLEEARQLVRRSFSTEEFLPGEKNLWEENYQRFLQSTHLDKNDIDFR